MGPIKGEKENKKNKCEGGMGVESFYFLMLEERRPLEMKGHVLFRGVVFAVVTVDVAMSAVKF